MSQSMKSAAEAPGRAASDGSQSFHDLPPSYLTHELRAPITAVRLGLEMLRDSLGTRLSHQEDGLLAIAIKNSSRMEGLIDDILDWAKMSAGKMDVRLAPAAAGDIAREAVEGLQALAIAKGIRLTREEPEALGPILAEPKRLQQVLVNLITNAIKFTPPRGRVVVSIKPGRGEHEGAAVFRVKDSGPGMSAAELEKIFKPFVQTRAGAESVGMKGTGLGLALSRLLVELHGGRIWAESWPGCGCEFYFTVPFAAAAGRDVRPIYSEPIEYHGLLLSLSRRLNAVLAFLGL